MSTEKTESPRLDAHDLWVIDMAPRTVEFYTPERGEYDMFEPPPNYKRLSRERRKELLALYYALPRIPSKP